MNLSTAAAAQSTASGLWLRLMVPLGVLAGLVLMTMAGLRHAQAPVPSAAGAHDFSVQRAMQDVVRIAAAPHPSGTEEHAAVRDYLVERLTALGLQPQVQAGVTMRAEDRSIGRVENIVARLQGAKPGKAVLLSAHYDSVHGGPGAADDGASISAILETVRVLKTGQTLQNDVIVLFSDGEEIGLLGAGLFAAQHPWAKDVGVIFNFEYRGNSGPVWMFETSSGNGRLVGEWQSALPAGPGNSLLNEVYRVMPNDTDFTVLKKLAPGMNFAAADNYNSYHTALDSADSLDPATLQQQGDILVALTRHFGALSLEGLKGDDVVYFDLPGIGLIHYGHGIAWLSGVVALALFIGTAVLAVRRSQARLSRLAKAAAIVLAASVGVAVLCQVGWFCLTLAHPGYRLSAHGSTYNGGWYLAAFGLLSATLFVTLLRTLRRHFEWTELVLAALATPMVLMLATLVVMPGGSFVFAWPLLTVLVALLATQLLPRVSATEPAAALLAMAAALPALLLFVPLIRLLYVALTPDLLAVTMVAATLLYGLVTPLLLALTASRSITRAGWVAVLVLLAGGAWTSGFDAQRPRPEHLMYAQSSDSGQAWLVSEDDELDEWAQGLFGADAKRMALKDVFGPGAEPAWTRPMPALFTAPPGVEVRSDRVEGGLRIIDVEVRSGRRAPRMQISVDGVPVQAALVQGEPYTLRETSKWRVNAYAMGDEPVRLELRLKPGTPFSLRARDISFGLPPSIGARPVGLIAKPFGSGDTLQVARVVRFQ